MSAQGLVVSHAQVTYGRRAVIHDASLPELQPGTLTALIGPNGAGKSTLLRGLAGLERLTGSVSLQGLQLTAMSVPERARLITYMPQHLPPGLGLSVIESVMAALRVGGSGGDYLEQAYAALQRIGIEHLADRMLNALSGGQRQLVSLAQLIARRPNVMLLDEPTSALDLRYQLRVMECVRGMVRQHQLIAVIVMHDISLAARYADNIAVLREGQVMGFGAAHEVLTPQLFADVYGVQARVERCSQQTLQILVDCPIGG
ncbi:iron ABC transporter [Pseudomonas endophytica]|uniref:Iron ABC transporter n=1 Tax=Pseudomonas endophytica TaxID=1563157 RepID=A0A0Q0X8X2_9PSED|nr:ABC transporter ATP-binding protein [Pseudomonas endophytica]KQB53546.1 iron ABC transporter [Pseudomonas endophytica]